HVRGYGKCHTVSPLPAAFARSQPRYSVLCGPLLVGSFHHVRDASEYLRDGVDKHHRVPDEITALADTVGWVNPWGVVEQAFARAAIASSDPAKRNLLRGQPFRPRTCLPLSVRLRAAAGCRTLFDGCCHLLSVFRPASAW